jgi:succinoglycan biosynthesis transport protein ExoP
MMSQPAEAYDARAMSLSSYLRSVWRHKFQIAGFGILGALLGLQLGAIRPIEYQSSADVEVRQASSTLGPSGLQTVGLVNIFTEQAVAGSTAVGRLARQDLASPLSARQLASRVTVTLPSKANLLTIAFRASSPRTARAGAEAWAHAYLAYRTKQLQHTITSSLENLGRQIDVIQTRLSSGGLTPVEQTMARSQLGQLRAREDSLNTLVIDAGDIVSPAQRPSSPAGLPSLAYTVAGLLIGLVGGLLFAFLRDQLDDRVANRVTHGVDVGAPFLGVVGSVGRRRRGSPGHGHGAEYAALAARAAVLFHRDGVRVFMFMGVAGASSAGVAAALAETLAQGRQPVVLVDGVGRENLSRAFLVPGSSGFVQVVRGQLGVAAAARSVPGLADLTLLPYGLPKPERLSLLNAERVESMLDELRGENAVLLVAAPDPVGEPEALLLAAFADAVILVADGRHGASADVRAAVDVLQMAGCRVSGVILRQDVESFVSRPATVSARPVSAMERGQ